MSLRAGAAIFVPNVAMPQPQSLRRQRGDELIQQLADAIAQEELSAKKLPVDGLFCPYCSHGAACVFHGQCKPFPAQQPHLIAEPQKIRSNRSASAKQLCEVDRVLAPPGLSLPRAEVNSKIGFAPAPGLIPMPSGLFKSSATTVDLDDWTDATSESRFTPRSSSSEISMASTCLVKASSNKLMGQGQHATPGRFRRFSHAVPTAAR
eukprot:TRINITY_DN109158_c0_g1_i1.p1 TRINITY_DN109158_c0_g1~~TRINITY_DN109158_c0_g1_i1.p1  ORF type:complete len:207 (-),score=39.88 TRINITY_DN109158_c0_g1_i1:682-1302(-)